MDFIPEAGGETKEAGRRPQRVLVVDDEDDILESVKILLESSIDGTAVDIAASGADGLKSLEATRYDLILTDYKMPHMNGLEFLAKARQVAPRTPRVMLTAFPDLDLALSALNEERIEKFLVKPIEPDELVTTVRTILAAGRDAAQASMARAKALDDLRRRPRG